MKRRKWGVDPVNPCSEWAMSLRETLTLAVSTVSVPVPFSTDSICRLWIQQPAGWTGSRGCYIPKKNMKNGWPNAVTKEPLSFSWAPRP